MEHRPHRPFETVVLTVALLYKSRWKVELFFQFENAVKTHGSGLGPSLHQILQVLSVTLFVSRSPKV